MLDAIILVLSTALSKMMVGGMAFRLLQAKKVFLKNWVVQVKAYRGFAGTHPFCLPWAAGARRASV